MVNYKRVVCEVAVLALLAVLAAAAPTPECKDHQTHYDQRQNGSENYRLNIDGVVIAVAPADSLLSAASDIDFNDLFDLDDFDLQRPPKPSDDKPPKPLPVEPKPQDGKPHDSNPEKPSKPEESSLGDVSLASDVQGHKKDAGNIKQQKAQRLKQRLASLLVPLLRRTRHH
ncbi:hypothetical protein O0L34_g7259 [Tuta absoluta]|nr:hypothetical protein O0L34_g7259 [Tuta absoluta]